MKSKILGFIMAICAMCMMSSCGYERVDAGHEGILVNLYHCIIDKEDISKISWIKGTWHICVNRSGHIDGVKTKTQTKHTRKQLWLHNYIICKENPNNVIDHIDHNPLNNRKSNLREVTPTENSQNITVQLPKSRTQYRNVTMERGKYRVRINGKSYGYFDSFEEAKIVADREREKVFPLTSNENGKIFINNMLEAAPVWSGTYTV